MKGKLSELDKLKARLIKVEAELDRCRATVIEDGWQTQKYAKKSRKWDYYAEEKRNLKDKIDDMETTASKP